MKVLVTGATGFVGGRLVPALGTGEETETTAVADATSAPNTN
ncbi:NAD-dependent epimerase/dehydratase family protein [Haloprofundus salinisoli]|nr:NAD-dependent epimerase/dehydratase family protein [Haloprofundus salinisoli]